MGGVIGGPWSGWLPGLALCGGCWPPGGQVAVEPLGILELVLAHLWVEPGRDGWLQGLGVRGSFSLLVGRAMVGGIGPGLLLACWWVGLVLALLLQGHGGPQACVHLLVGEAGALGVSSLVFAC